MPPSDLPPAAPLPAWKPGPPPLDRDGRYDCGIDCGGFCACEVIGGAVYFDDQYEPYTAKKISDMDRWADVVMHFPIPDPPLPGEQSDAPA